MAKNPVSTETLLERHLAEVDAELEKLRPMHEQYLELEDYKARMTGTAPRSRSTARSTSGTRRTRRSSGDGPGRREQFMQVLADQPNSTIPDVAKAIDGVSPNYLYRVRDGLVEDGFIVEGDSGHFSLTDEGKKHLAGQSQPAAAAA